MPVAARGPTLALVAAIAVLASTVVEHALHWPLRTTEPAASSAHPQAVLHTPASVSSRALLQLPGWHLFGESPRRPAVLRKAPETALSLRLKGIFYSPGDNHGRAIIAAPGAEEKQYRIGDALPGNAVLRAVLQFKVIIKRGGRLESLSLPVARTDAAARQTGPNVQGGGSVAQNGPAAPRQQQTASWPEDRDH